MDIGHKLTWNVHGNVIVYIYMWDKIFTKKLINLL